MHKDVLSYEKGHPNPLFYRPDWMSLNGKWDFVFDDDNLGLKEGWSSKIPDGTIKIKVPYSYEVPSSGVKDKKEHKILWYFKTFQNPHYEGKSMLHFERCDYVFDGWLNGHYLGKHIGGYDAFRYDVSDFLIEGENLLVVRTYDDKDPAHVRGKQTWEEKPFACFYPTTSGLYGDVWLEDVNKASIQGYDARASYEEKAVYLRLLFTPEAVGSQCMLEVSFRGKMAVSDSFTVTGIYMERCINIPSKMFKRWSPAYPCLYDLKMSLARNGDFLDVVYSYFGVNEISQKKNYIALNGKKRYLKFVLYQGYNPKGGYTFTEDEYKKDISLIKGMGFNGVRVHEKVESELFYYLCDREGVLNDVELPSPHKYEPLEEDEVQSEFGRIVTDHVGHPSTIAYVGYNESWGVEDIATSLDQQKLSTSLYQMANRIDWTRPCISNDGWEHTESDLLSLHNYAESKEEMEEFASELKDKLSRGENFDVSLGKKAFAGDFHYSGQPLMMSEFFGAIYKTDEAKGWGYGAPVKSNRAYLQRYRALLKVLKKCDFAGYCATQFADTYQEKNGFVDENRNVKASIDSIKKINRSY
ncbi:MAG: hypothetical protein LKF75_04705 [Bacilli bacterium]|jgi:hypothetical protein|nr:hypothetical protein [Bacilli bacterium]MCH4228973.1 hypothetical protein [Bacilli bacterium]MCH4277741.1 hypothetical protein [Bacilli bacterium]